MSGVYLTDEELDRLGDAELALPHAAQLLYMRVLRRFMNYADGVVGRSRRLSYQQMREQLEVLPKCGPMGARVDLSRDQIKRLLKRLEKAGLIVALHDKSRMAPVVYRLPLAVCDLVRPLENRHNSATVNAPRKNAVKTRAGVVHSATESPRLMRHTSEYPSNNSLSAAQVKRFRMSLDWGVFDEDEFSESCAMMNLCWDLVGQVDRESIRQEFVRYQLGVGDEDTQEGWEHKFLRSVQYWADKGRVPKFVDQE